MKAIFCTKYGPPEVLKFKFINKPVPKPGEVLIKIKATAVNSGDVRVRGLAVNGLMRVIMSIVLGFSKPRNPILGSVFSGIVAETGDNVNLFKTGDEVYGMTGLKMGTYADYIVVKENSPITLKPLKASFEEAAAIIFGGSTAIYFLKKAKIELKPNSEVLIYGATGSVGTSAIQIAKHYKARVTADCSEAGFDLVQSLGADEVVNYRKNDFPKTGTKYDIIFDAVGKIKKKDWAKFLSKDGVFVSVGTLDVASESIDQLLFLKDLFDSQHLKAVIDRTYSFEKMVEAHRYVDTGRKKGNVVVRVNQES